MSGEDDCNECTVLLVMVDDDTDICIACCKIRYHLVYRNPSSPTIELIPCLTNKRNSDPESLHPPNTL